MLRREEIERFYKDLEGLDLKFPVAAIAKATGHSKANVSKYLSRKLEPSEAFLKAFYEKVQNSGKNVSPEVFVSHKEGESLHLAILAIAESNKGLVRANTAIAEANKILAEKVPESDSSEIPLAVESRFSDLLELIAELGTGTRWKSKQEALAVLSKLWHGKTASVSKNKKDDYVPLSDFVLANYQQSGRLFKHQVNYYGTKFRELKKELGLAKDFTLYSIRHTRAIHLSQDGADPYTIMQR